ncbi:MAG: peptide deformylase [Candidatus Omnitrophota bacterium]|nr:MAG: peptide deformylase [Candidatus Omnitrophota bacterium]
MQEAKGMKLRIYTWPEQILRKRCKDVLIVDDETRNILSEMYALMKIHKGIGLAANQAGINLRLIVVEAEDKVFKLVNPQITKREGRIALKEGCLSFPGLELEVKRAKKVWLSALSEKGEPIDIEAEDVLAVAFQHEIDHINGIEFIDRISFWQKFKVLPQLKKIKRRTVERNR